MNLNFNHSLFRVILKIVFLLENVSTIGKRALVTIPAVSEEADRIIVLCRDSAQGVQFAVKANKHRTNSCLKSTLWGS